MDGSTQYEAIRKANAMGFNIGYPDELVDDAKLDEYYRGLTLEDDSLFHNVRRIRIFDRLREIQDFHKPIDRNDWRELAKRAATVNAFNMPLHNMIRKCDFLSKLREYKTKLMNFVCIFRNTGGNPTRSHVFGQSVSFLLNHSDFHW